MRSLALLVVLAGLTGCAGMTSHSGGEGLADARAKIAMGRCDEGLVADLRRYKAPELEQEAAYVCLQQGELEAVELLLSDYGKRHAGAFNPDYSAYLYALAQQVRFELTEATDDVERLREGRLVHQRYADFVQTYPQSEYRTEVGPRLTTLLNEMAEAEYRLAQAAAAAGNAAQAQDRVRYLLRYYPHSSVARQASDWLERTAPEEAENIPPGNAW